MHEKTVYCVTFRDDNTDEDRCLKISDKDEAIEVAKALHELLDFSNDTVKVLEGEPKVIWESN